MIRRQGVSLSGIGCNISLGDEEAEFDIFQKASPLPLQNGQKVIACPSSALIFMLSKIARLPSELPALEMPFGGQF